MPPATARSANERTLGALWLLYGVLRIVMAALLVVFSATARLMAGALLTRVPNPLTMMFLFEVLYWIIIAWCIACAILSSLAAGALTSGSHSAPGLAVIASFVSLPELPFGLILGVYTLLVFHQRAATAV
jgi:hypothetical protein